LFFVGVAVIGFGGGLFSVGTLSVAMGMERKEFVGLALGAWGAVQATAAGISVALGGALRDVISGLASSGALGTALVQPVTGYSFVYHIEMVLLFITLIAIGPLVRRASDPVSPSPERFGLADLPG
jgi:BCD family chlorophyll transporter-like MFS transporter